MSGTHAAGAFEDLEGEAQILSQFDGNQTADLQRYPKIVQVTSRYPERCDALRCDDDVRVVYWHLVSYEGAVE